MPNNDKVERNTDTIVIKNLAYWLRSSQIQENGKPKCVKGDKRNKTTQPHTIPSCWIAFYLSFIGNSVRTQLRHCYWIRSFTNMAHMTKFSHLTMTTLLQDVPYDVILTCKVKMLQDFTTKFQPNGSYVFGSPGIGTRRLQTKGILVRNSKVQTLPLYIQLTLRSFFRIALKTLWTSAPGSSSKITCVKRSQNCFHSHKIAPKVVVLQF